MNASNNQGWIVVVAGLLVVPALLSFLNGNLSRNHSAADTERDVKMISAGQPVSFRYELEDREDFFTNPRDDSSSNTVRDSAPHYSAMHYVTTNDNASSPTSAYSSDNSPRVTEQKCQCSCRFERQHFRRCLGRSGPPPRFFVRRR